jgi:ATP-binding cassette subfamily B protein
MVEVSRIACADEFVTQMEKGYDSPVSQGGTNVSGGQRQRLCIARALATHPEILVFDDSFSALDFKTDLQVRENIKKAYPETTKVIVAQRIGTIMDADEILVLEDGKVVGQGRHQDLLKSCPTYLAIALSQLSKEELGL